MRRRALLAASLLTPSAAHPQYPSLGGVVTQGLQLTLLASWGDPVTKDAPRFNPAQLTPAAAETQFGRRSHVVGLLPSPPAADGVLRATLVVAHGRFFSSMRVLDSSVRALDGSTQGASILSLERRSQGWVIVEGGLLNRRLTATSLTRTSEGTATQGLVGPASGCITPWGTALICEVGSSGWPADSHGHILEFDPRDPTAVPVRRSALGRMGANYCTAGITVDGRAVVFFSARVQLFRFLSDADARAPDALDRGQLSLAQVDGRNLRWQPVASDIYAGGGATGMPMAVAPDGSRLYWWTDQGWLYDVTFPQGDLAAGTATIRTLLQWRAPPTDVIRPPPARAPVAYPYGTMSISAFPGSGLLLGSGQINDVAPGGFWRLATNGARRAELAPIWVTPAQVWASGSALTPDRSTLILGFEAPERLDPAIMGSWPDFSASMPPRGGLVAVTRIDGRSF